MGSNMTKIMLVEDDKSLREIYGVRLLAEGYDIVSAGDGEEALAMAIKERPKLIITDVMMPKISGFDMLDILRSTTETKEIKIIMMTALSSDDQRARGEQMGADRYLVKSQVGIEDVVRVVHEVLGDGGAKPAAPAPMAGPPTAPPPPSTPPPAPPAAPIPPPSAPPPPAPLTPAAMAPPAPLPVLHPEPVPPPPSQATVHQMPPVNSSTATPASSKQRVIQPINSATPSVNIDDLLNKELARESGIAPTPAPTPPPLPMAPPNPPAGPPPAGYPQ
jgi:CheY-like chemotaxis protein